MLNVLQCKIKNVFFLLSIILLTSCAIAPSASVVERLDTLVGKDIKSAFLLLGKSDYAQSYAKRIDYVWSNYPEVGKFTHSKNPILQQSDCVIVIMTTDFNHVIKQWAYMGNFGPCDPTFYSIVNYRK